MSDQIRDHVALAMHEGRDHALDGAELGASPLCNCYDLADRALDALGGVQHKTERAYVTDWRDEHGTPRQMLVWDYGLNVPLYERDFVTYSTRWTLAEPQPVNDVPGETNG